MKTLIGIIIWVACGMSSAVLATKVNDSKKPMYLGTFTAFSLTGPVGLIIVSVTYLSERTPCVLDCGGK